MSWNVGLSTAKPNNYYGVRHDVCSGNKIIEFVILREVRPKNLRYESEILRGVYHEPQRDSSLRSK